MRGGGFASVALHLLVVVVVVAALCGPGIVATKARVAQSSCALLSARPIWDHVWVGYRVRFMVAVVARSIVVSCLTTMVMTHLAFTDVMALLAIKWSRMCLRSD